MKSLWSSMRDYRKECVLGPLFKWIEALFELLVPLVVAKIIDEAIPSANRSLMIRWCLLLGALGLLGFLFSVTAQFFSARAATGFAARLRGALLRKIASLSDSDLDEQGTATLLTRMTSDVGQIQTGVNMGLRLLLRSPFVTVGAVLMAFTVDPEAAWTLAVTTVLLFLIVTGILLGSIPLYARVQRKLDDLTRRVREAISGVRVLRAFRRESAQNDAFRQDNEQLAHLQRRAGRFSSLLSPVTYVVVHGGVIALLWIGGWHVSDGIRSQGDVVAVYNYMAQILVELIKFASLLITLSRTLASARRVAQVMELQPSGNASEPVSQETGGENVLLHCDHVSLRYRGTVEDSLHEICFDAARGETVGVIGGTGSGKSTLAQLLAGAYEATGGNVFLNGKNIRLWDRKELRQTVAVVAQKTVLFRGTLRDNLRFGAPEATDEQLIEALEAAQGGDILRSRPEGLDAMLEEGGRNFSGGQRQRISIARALVCRPALLILDDSSSALDYATDAKLRISLRTLPWNPAVILISQRAASLLHADRILVLDHGNQVGLGDHSSLLHDCAVYREIYESQFPPESENETIRLAAEHRREEGAL